jgi:hypothetical protein
MSIEPVRSDPPPSGAKPFPIPVTFFTAKGDEDEHGDREWEETTEEFQCRPVVNGGVLAGLDAISGRSENRRGGGAVYDLFDAAFLPDSLRRWREITGGRDHYIDAKAIVKVALSLYEVYTGPRPTRAPADS